MEATRSLAEAIDWRSDLLTDREKTLERIYAKTYPMVLHYVKENGGTPDDAKDVFQEALILFYEKVVHDRLTLTAAVSTYLVAICKNLWRQEWDKRRRKTPLDSVDTDLLWETPIPEKDPSQPKLTDFVEQLGEKCKDILVRFYYFGQRLEQIADRHGYRNIHTATVQKFKCLERLRKSVSHLTIDHFKS